MDNPQRWSQDFRSADLMIFNFSKLKKLRKYEVI